MAENDVDCRCALSLTNLFNRSYIIKKLGSAIDQTDGRDLILSHPSSESICQHARASSYYTQLKTKLHKT